ncbi:MAG TPA: preprotein translocase subunit SecE [Pseudonocardiaceae bacterium]
MSEDRTEQDEQDQANGEETSSRPATAAARRERRTAGSRPAGRAGRAAARAGAESTAPTSPDVKGRPTPSGRREERVSLVARIVRFLREVVAELRKVIWPTRKELVTYTIVVLVFVSFMVALVAMLDIAFAKGVFWLFG